MLSIELPLSCRKCQSKCGRWDKKCRKAKRSRKKPKSCNCLAYQRQLDKNNIFFNTMADVIFQILALCVEKKTQKMRNSGIVRKTSKKILLIFVSHQRNERNNLLASSDSFFLLLSNNLTDIGPIFISSIFLIDRKGEETNWRHQM